ncbi:hypothetical protein BGZ65_002213 [Modicella reniformis]|uniref:F-box domain-containing protein n=1 Tax=Modicella reniformis TaxID=1440133 RepID=A0A9P6M9P0_9FUNG|nr:hypothetical protein BGZ65_002213 [Modicella reniformis]
MFRYVKKGALDLLAMILPSSLLESIRQDFLSTQATNKQHNSYHECVATPVRLLLELLLVIFERVNHPTSLTEETILSQHSDDNEVSDSRRQPNIPNPSKPTLDFPYEILMLVFQYLPASDLFSVIAVNRLWRQIALLETKQIDLSECFPMDCLGLEDGVYSDFDFVCNLFSMFPLISILVIKDCYMRDRDLRVVTAGILAGKMAFTKATGPAVGSEAYRDAQRAIAKRRQQRHQCGASRDGQLTEDCNISSTRLESTSTSETSMSVRPVTKLMRGTIQEELREFSRSVGTCVLVRQARNTLRKKILERLEHNLEQKEIQQYFWMLENGFDPETFYSSTAASVSSSSGDMKRYPLVPITHYRFQDCCFAKDWGAVMDVNKLPMIGLAAAISGQGLVVDLEGSYGAPSKSIKTMLGFCFGPQCVISLDLNFRHTHMELQHVARMLSENPILDKIDIVDSPAYHGLVRLPALRGLGEILERMQEACQDLDEGGLETSLQQAKLLLLDLEKAIKDEESDQKRREADPGPNPDESSDLTEPSRFMTPLQPPLNNPNRPIKSLSQQLEFPEATSVSDRIRTAKYSEDIGLGGSLPTPDPEVEDHYYYGYDDDDEEEQDRPEGDNTDLRTDSLQTEGASISFNCRSGPLTTTTPPSSLSSSPTPLPPSVSLQQSLPVVLIPEQHPVAIALRMAKTILQLKADPNVYNHDGRSVVLCASYMGFQPMEALLIEHGGYLKELIRIRETM